MEHPRHNQETYGHFRLNMAPKISNCVATNASKQTNRYLHRHEVTARGRISAAPIMPPRYQDISKISDTLLSGETVPAQVKIVKTAHSLFVILSPSWFLIAISRHAARVVGGAGGECMCGERPSVGGHHSARHD